MLAEMQTFISDPFFFRMPLLSMILESPISFPLSMITLTCSFLQFLEDRKHKSERQDGNLFLSTEVVSGLHVHGPIGSKDMSPLSPARRMNI